MRNIARSVGPAAVRLVVHLRVNTEEAQRKQMRNEKSATDDMETECRRTHE